ncbi:MAG TPA: tRNA (N6-threonylcarbamoyladenosine(37)-N6)-methyltransferase TrmO [Syntrophomonadaceae bacterium]|nr:tRNA (N6-threonylcarbamoyladenosine(37)-N6)-methyltransferase TrmO [Syntrophomonadaceae bacterium]
MDTISIRPIGQVTAAVQDPGEMPPGGLESTIEVFAPYADALLGIEENSHLWILGWFHKASRKVLQTVPGRVNTDLPPYGVFALRSPTRPNPISLSLVQLQGVEGRFLRVKGLDAVNGTPVLDIKPYFENDSIFSPDTPYIRAKTRDMRLHTLERLARSHHREECPDFHLAVRMGLIAEDCFGHLNSPGIRLWVRGPACLGDCLQGVSRARLANPARFHFEARSDCRESTWNLDRQWLTISTRPGPFPERVDQTPDSELFEIHLSEEVGDQTVFREPNLHGTGPEL